MFNTVRHSQILCPGCSSHSRATHWLWGSPVSNHDCKALLSFAGSDSGAVYGGAAADKVAHVNSAFSLSAVPRGRLSELDIQHSAHWSVVNVLDLVLLLIKCLSPLTSHFQGRPGRKPGVWILKIQPVHVGSEVITFRSYVSGPAVTRHFVHSCAIVGARYNVWSPVVRVAGAFTSFYVDSSSRRRPRSFFPRFRFIFVIQQYSKSFVLLLCVVFDGWKRWLGASFLI